MPKRLYVISDMQFNVATGSEKFETNHENIKKKYAKAGYKTPQIVYWNVRANTPDFPVRGDESDVALVSGFSPSILKDLVETGSVTDPFLFMRKVLDGERYKLLSLSSGSSS